ncbi:hypothetical protein BSF42_28060 [Flavobacterium sp. ACN6]|nr:hypothetical protein BSF42_28060 [Flavobacterium sp. ACN6]
MLLANLYASKNQIHKKLIKPSLFIKIEMCNKLQFMQFITFLTT